MLGHVDVDERNLHFLMSGTKASLVRNTQNMKQLNQPLETPITIEKCTTSGGRTKEANEKYFVFVHG